MIEHIRYKFFEFTNNFKFKLMDVVFNFMWLKLFESLYVYKKKEKKEKKVCYVINHCSKYIQKNSYIQTFFFFLENVYTNLIDECGSF